ncbi:hypothetical protein PpBr36_04112 [Pyricularia pennisetigena]|uniref:hypothetical protein n=1 Tax=Pyricularia pennisetigena TaxID=1578925 RepID=UPI00115171FA|nr:hypothetical protein PpBr36_04112 [Pyricularia pennisetigena]TLS27262.1 hypothetical protein PpBr36_04112 [Pyricularia pennisetigena]
MRAKLWFASVPCHNQILWLGDSSAFVRASGWGRGPPPATVPRQLDLIITTIKVNESNQSVRESKLYTTNM